MQKIIRTVQKRFQGLFLATIICLAAGLCGGCSNIPVAIGVGIASGVGYYAFKEVHGQKGTAGMADTKSQRTDIRDRQSPQEATATPAENQPDQSSENLLEPLKINPDTRPDNPAE